MVEHTPHQPRTPPWRESRHLSFVAKPLSIEGDPQTAADLIRASSYLEAITKHFIEFGPLEEREAWEVSYELSHHNAWHQHEVEQEQRRGEAQSAYHEVTLLQLRAVSERRILALEETGQAATPDFYVLQHLDSLIEQALLEQQALEALMAASAPAHAGPFEPSSDWPKELPF